MDIPAPFLGRIRELRPDLQLNSICRGNDAGQSDVFIIDEAWVFRFPTNDHNRANATREAILLDRIRNRLPLAVPEMQVREPDVFAHRLIEGEPLTPWLIASLDDATQQRLADQLGEFLRALHAIEKTPDLPEGPFDVQDSSAAAYRDSFARRLAEIRALLYPQLKGIQREWVERLFADALRDASFWEYDVRLLHNDFKVEHVLFDARTQRLSGVIDFGIAGFSDPSIDICNLLQWYGETFITRMIPAYPELRAMMPRARFGAFICEVDNLMNGLEQPGGLNWFFANVGTNHDIRFPILP